MISNCSAAQSAALSVARRDGARQSGSDEVAPDADLRTDLPRYRVWKDGELVAEPTDICDDWRDDFVSFVIGCSFTFESGAAARRHPGAPSRTGLQRADVSHEHRLPAGRRAFTGRWSFRCVRSNRPMRFAPCKSRRAIQPSTARRCISACPSKSASRDLSRPDFGDAVPVAADELPVFWACGVTPQAVLMAAKLPLAITHSPGCMLVTDLRDEDLKRN